MAILDLRYSALPDEVKHNLTEDQFELSKVDVVEEGKTVPETTEYIDLTTGIRLVHQKGETADGDLLPTHDLSGARGKDYTQWQS